MQLPLWSQTEMNLICGHFSLFVFLVFSKFVVSSRVNSITDNTNQWVLFGNLDHVKCNLQKVHRRKQKSARFFPSASSLTRFLNVYLVNNLNVFFSLTHTFSSQIFMFWMCMIWCLWHWCSTLFVACIELTGQCKERVLFYEGKTFEFLTTDALIQYWYRMRDNLGKKCTRLDVDFKSYLLIWWQYWHFNITAFTSSKWIRVCNML